MHDCIFCQIIAGERPASFVEKAEEYVVFLDINQASPGHLMIVPREHHPCWWDLLPEVAATMAKASQHLALAVKTAMNADGVNLLLNNGKAAGQVVWHAHLHVIPRWEGDRRFTRPPEYVERAILDERATRIRAALAEQENHGAAE
ncbi:MAG TPA: HIT family protein [Chloroflexi bacterium]|nr:HIT family protein [Chloroflexota bacterium]